MLLLSLACAGGCAATHVAPLQTVDGSAALKPDERRLWEDGKSLEGWLDRSGLVSTDSLATAYVEQVAGRLLRAPHEGSVPSLRVRILRHPLLNAFALPEGAVYVHTGLLARLDNEAQLATVLAHELTHVTRRHALRERRTAHNKQGLVHVFTGVMVLAGSAAGGASLGSELAGVSESVGELWTTSAVNGYSRELETEADELGLEWVARAGYDPRQAPRVIEHLLEDYDESGVEERFVLGTHPRLQDRLANYQRLLHDRHGISPSAGDTADAVTALSEVLGPLLLDNAELDLRLGRLRSAEAAVARRLARWPASARDHLLLGHIARRRDRPDEAIAEYGAAASLDSTYAEPHRELGLVYRGLGRSDEARQEFERYLALDPAAIDGPVVRWYLSQP